MSKKILSILLALTILAGVLAVVPISASAQEAEIAEDGAGAYLAETGYYDYSTFNSRLDTCKSNYPNGSYSSWQAPSGWYECWAYANQITYEVFGSYGYTWNYHQDRNSIYPGDLIRYGGYYGTGHSIVVTAVDGDTIYYTDRNGTSNYNMVRWGASINRWDIYFISGDKGRQGIYHAPNWDSVIPWVNPISYANMDVNFWVDGKDQVNINGIGNIQVYVDGQLQGYGTDFCQDVVVGKNYEVRVNITNSDYHLGGVDTSDGTGLTGTTGSGGTRVRIVIVKDSGGKTDIPDGEYVIASVIDQSYGLDIAGDNIPSSNGDNIILWPIGDTPRPQDVFLLTNLGNGYYSIKQNYSKMAVDVNGASQNRNENIQSLTWNGSNAQQWKICYDSSAGGYTFQARCSGMYLTLEAGKIANGTNVYQALKSSTPKAQAWKLIRHLQDNMISVQDVRIENVDDKVEPSISVKVDNKELIRNTDYSVEITTDIEDGEGKVTIKGINNFCGTVVKDFKIIYSHYEYIVLEDNTIEITKYTGTVRELEIPESIDGYRVSSIGGRAFANNQIIKGLYCNIPVIKSRAFSSCRSLTKVFINDAVTDIDLTAFSGCYKLTMIIVNANNQNYSSSKGMLFNKDKTELYYYVMGRTETTVTVPDTVTKIRDETFMNCTSLVEIVLPAGLTEIGFRTFIFCESLESISIPNYVTSIGVEAFGACFKLKTVEIPSSVKSIDDSAFIECSHLEDVYYYGTQKQWNAIQIGNYNESLLNAKIHFLGQESFINGDADGDGEVTIFDATAIQRHLADLPVTNFDEAAADADEDGEVSIFDATAIQRWLASLPTNENIGQIISEEDEFPYLKNKPLCPYCNSDNVGYIIYGLPLPDDDYSNAFHEKVKNGEIVFGGCEPDEMNRNWQCHNCGNKF